MGESISAREGSFLFPITPVFNSSLQYSHNQSISLISKPQDQGTIILSLSLTTFSCHIRSCTPYHTPSKHLNSNESPTKIVDDIQPPNFSINHRSAPWLVITPIIDLGLDSLVYLMYRYVIQAYTSRHY